MKRCLFPSFLLCFLTLAAWSQRLTKNQAYQNYFDQYKDMAVDQMRRYKIPASITLAQGVLESAA